MALELFTYKRYAAVAQYTGDDEYVIIPQEYNGLPVTEIRPGAFANNQKLECVFIPSTLQAIGDNAFYNCRNLEFVGLGLEDKEHKDIPSMPEDKWPDLDVLLADDIPVLSEIPEKVQVVGTGAFARTALRNVAFGAKEIELGERVFESCMQLGMVSFMHSHRLQLGKYVFKDSSIWRFYAPDIVMETVPEGAFANCRKLVSVLMQFKAVGARAFYNCEMLENIPIPKEFRSVGIEAFDGCRKLAGIKLPKMRKPARPITPKPTDRPELRTTIKKPIDDDIQTFFGGGDTKKDDLDVFLLDEQMEEPFPVILPEEEIDDRKEPLLMLDAKGINSGGRKVPAVIRGIWERISGTYCFRIQVPMAMDNVKLQIMDSKRLVSFKPLLDYISREVVSVIITGKQDGGCYAVYDIRMLANTASGTLSTEMFRIIVDRLRRFDPKMKDTLSTKSLYGMRTDAEFETLLKMCGDSFPSWVIKAYNRNKELSRGRSGRLGDEEAKHARHAVELLMNIDWLPYVVTVPPAEEVRRILDESFHGLEEVKTRIMGIAARIRRSGKLPKWGILISGEAGTGKTSVAKAVARIFGLPLIQLDMSTLGDDHDGISGSYRIFANARPGMLLQKMHEVRSSTGVLLINELDKAGEQQGGRNIADVLLSILDKTGFYENFLEETIPTDNLLAIGTCNDLNKISKPIKDRFMIIDIPSYTAEEKRVIFNKHSFPARVAGDQLTPEQISLDREAVELLVSEYALEPGARDLEMYSERFIEDYCLSTDGMTGAKRVYTAADVRALLGPSNKTVQHFAMHPGQINAAFHYKGMAYFFLMEAMITSGTGKFKVLGPMADTQKEYCEVAYLCVRNALGNGMFDLGKLDVTIFVAQSIPEGADNRVGFACYAAICSKLMNINLAIDNACFIGGCDINGAIYTDGNRITPLLRSMKARGIKTLFAPMGTNDLIHEKADSDCDVIIVEAPDAKTLFSIAVAQSKQAC